MPVETIDLDVAPADDWVLAATNPQYISIRRSDFARWAVAIGPTLPSRDLSGFQMNLSTWNLPEIFQVEVPIEGNVYVRNLQSIQTSANNDRSRFSAIVGTLSI